MTSRTKKILKEEIKKILKEEMEDNEIISKIGSLSRDGYVSEIANQLKDSPSREDTRELLTTLPIFYLHKLKFALNKMINDIKGTKWETVLSMIH